MAFVPIAIGLSQGNQFSSGRVLKTYLAGTTTPTPMYTDATGATSSATVLYDSSNMPTISDSVVFPHIDTTVGDIKYRLYPDQAAADADTGYLYEWDNISSTTGTSDSALTTSVEHFLGSDASSKVFTLANTYSPGNNSLSVYLNGQKLRLGASYDYTETSSTTVTLVNTPLDNDTYTFVIGAQQTTASLVSSSVTYQPAGSGAVATNVQAKLRESVSVLDFGAGTDIGADINTATAAGYTRIRIPAGSYTQSTALTSNQEVHLFAEGWNDYGFNPVVITKDFDSPHIESTSVFSSLGIEWSGLGVSGTSAGIIMHGKFHIVGSITNQPANGLEITETSGSHNNNGSYLAGALASNGGSGLWIENTAVSGSSNIDQNVMSIPYLRCNSNGVDGVTIRAGLYNRFWNLRCDNNGRYGLNINATNTVSTNTVYVYAENNTTADYYWEESTPNLITDNEFVAYRGTLPTTIVNTGSTFYSQGNTARLGRDFKGVMTNAQQPWVKVHNSADATNVTGDGTVWTVTYGTEIKDTQGNFASNTFTAPITGRYKVAGGIYMSNLGAATYTRCQLNVVTTNRTYNVFDGGLDNLKSSSNTYAIPFSLLADMDSNETLTVTLEVSGGAKSVTVNGAAVGAQTWLDICLDG